MMPESLPQEPARSASQHGAAKLRTCHDAKTRCRVGRQRAPVGHKAIPGRSFALLPKAKEIATMPDAFVATQTEWLSRWPGHETDSVKPGSAVCARRGVDYAEWRARSCWSSGLGIHAAVSGGSSMVGIVSSYLCKSGTNALSCRSKTTWPGLPGIQPL
jgi:hypothetical protein